MNDSNSRWVWIIVGGCLLVILLALLLPRQRGKRANDTASPNAPSSDTAEDSLDARRARSFRRSTASATAPAPTAEEIVTNKLNQFVRSRRELIHALARGYNAEVLPEMEQFFAAVEAGRWDEMDAIYKALRERREREEIPLSSVKLWPALLETLGVAEAVRDWPSQKLLDYGNSILDSLRPGMVYVGGTDPGRFIPTLLNETAEGERHVVLTQNAFADGTYMDYVRFQCGDQISVPTAEDSQRAFSDYLSDAQQRLQHDRDFPNEPKQLRAGEDVRVIDNRVQVSGQVAVMAINEKLIQTLMQKNPDTPFAMEESFPFKSVFAEATSLGPIMELRARDEQSALTRERAGQSADYWRTTAQQLLADPEAAGSRDVRMTYAKMAASHAGLFLDRGYTAEAEQAFRAATDIAPASPEAVYRYVNVLVEQKRFDEAIRITRSAINADADNQHQFGPLARELNRLKTTQGQ